MYCYKAFTQHVNLYNMILIYIQILLKMNIVYARTTTTFFKRSIKLIEKIKLNYKQCSTQTRKGTIKSKIWSKEQMVQIENSLQEGRT